MSDKLKYNKRGVSADKKEVHQAVKHLDEGLYPNAFCKILPDLVGQDGAYCNIMHADTAGTKPSLAYLYWKETGELQVWKDIVQDAIVMNLDDMACVGATDRVVFSSTIGRNKQLITGEVLKAIIQGSAGVLEQISELGVESTLAGGETADVGDIIRTIDIGFTAFARMPRNKVIENEIRPGDVIVGLASYGQASYEDRYNSGIGSNGLTSARHDVLDHIYAEKYPESFDPAMDMDLAYAGSRSLTEQESETGRTVGQLLLSPTRTYAPVLKKIFEQHRAEIHGVIHCTGGAQTKVLNFIDQLEVVKDRLFPVPPVFQLIQSETGTAWKEMYQVFNMGHRLELYVPEKLATSIIEIADEFDIDAQVIGKCKKAKQKQVTIRSEKGTFHYS